MIRIDGSYGEGGGQLIRTSLALSTALQQPFEAFNIRQGREQPGLKAQHIACLDALRKLCSAKFSEVKVGSESLSYTPGKLSAKRVEIDIATAGSVTLLLQSILVPCMLAEHPISIRIKGGTCGKWQMPFEYFENVLLPQLRKYAAITARIEKRGYYPKGGGVVDIKISPEYSLRTKDSSQPIVLVERGSLLQVKGISHASADLSQSGVAERQASAAKASLASLGCSIDIRVEYSNTASTGSGITLWAFFGNEEPDEKNPAIIGADAIGERGKPAEDVGKDAAKMLIEEIKSGAPVDRCMADNLIPFIALFGGRIRVSGITQHTMTNIHAAEQFLGKIFEINEKEKIILRK